MSTLSQLLSTARDGLTAQSYGLGVTGQNISNVNTPGYVRREAMLETRALGTQTTGSVEAVGLRRVTDTFLERRQFEATGLSSAASEHDSRLASLEALFNDSAGTGLGGAVDAMFGSFSRLAASPSDSTVRQSVLDSASNLAQRVRDTANTIAKGRQDLLQDAQATTTQVNDRSRAIARLNTQISAAETQGNDAADLKDQRNRLLLELASMVDVRTIVSGSGIMVQASGTTLVEGGEARELSISVDSSSRMQILASRSDGPPTDVTRFLTGGKLAGIREARDVDLLEVGQKLDQFVFDVATAVNDQHRQGFGLDGATGRDIFAVTTVPEGAARALTLSADVAGNPNALAASSSAGALPGNSDNAAALSDLASTPVVFGAKRTAAEGYGDIVGDVATRRADSRRMVESREAISAQIDAMHEAMSGVSLDEEFVNLTKFQRAYQASARVLTTTDEILQELVNLKR
ncbi:MAG TPA: flagellar hook-associated protein FlgK [Polyangiaceae bacterium]|nr:flagellar hook-associated protein FlgK [Polyangiaceae bacterium]